VKDLEDRKGVLSWFASNHVAANLLMLIIIVAGLLSIFSAKLEVFPEMNLDIITITVPYLGASPEDVEDGVCLRVEEINRLSKFQLHSFLYWTQIDPSRS